MTVFPTNATLTFQLPQGESTTVDALGNPIVSAAELVVEASFNTVSNRQSGQENHYQTRVDMLHLEGRCNRVYVNSDPIVETVPPRLPPEIVPGVKVPCTLTDVGTQDETAGYFVLEASLPSRWSVDPILGGKINGYFYVTNVMGEVS